MQVLLRPGALWSGHPWVGTYGQALAVASWCWRAEDPPLPAASGGTSTSTSLPPDAADWFRQATAEATSNTTSVQVFPNASPVRGVYPGKTASRANEPRTDSAPLLTDWTINRRLYCPPTPSAVPHPPTTGTRLLRNWNCQRAGATAAAKQAN